MTNKLYRVTVLGKLQRLSIVDIHGKLGQFNEGLGINTFRNRVKEMGMTKAIAHYLDNDLWAARNEFIYQPRNTAQINELVQELLYSEV